MTARPTRAGAAGRRRKLLVLSHVLPFPRNAGQQQRVFYTLQEARKVFHVTFVTAVDDRQALTVGDRLRALCDDVILLPARTSRNRVARLWHRGAGSLYAMTRGLKRSNYAIGRVEFHPRRIERLLRDRQFDCALFEYWHAADSIPAFRRLGIPCVLDMHDILWKTLEQDVTPRGGVPVPWRRWVVRKYQRQEEHAWGRFDGIVAINRVEEQFVRTRVPADRQIFYAPMGTDAELWPYVAAPLQPPRIACYGGFGNPHNQRSAIRCATAIMPIVWRDVPNAELWLVGNNPPASLRQFTRDPRVKVTGYVEDVKQVLRTMSAVLCPWTGTFGFRSRLIEVMSLGIPVVASPDAVSGMELRDGHGVLLGESDIELANQTLRLLADPAYSGEQGRTARAEVERLFTIERTYGTWMTELDAWLAQPSLERTAVLSHG